MLRLMVLMQVHSLPHVLLLVGIVLKPSHTPVPVSTRA